VTAADLATVLLTMVGVAGLVLVAVASVAMLRAARLLRRTAERLEREALPLIEQAHASLERADVDAARAEQALDDAEQLAARIGGAGRLMENAVASPVLKVMAVGRGVKRSRRHDDRGER
jgi:exonuclease VII small subunit